MEKIEREKSIDTLCFHEQFLLAIFRPGDQQAPRPPKYSS
jgi:hypothetical protein